MKRYFYLMLLLPYAFAYQPEIDLNPPDYVEESPGRDFIPEFSKPGSLFGQGDKPLFSDRRAMKPDDLITILVDEKSSANYSTSKTYNNNSAGNRTSPQLQYNGTNEQALARTNELNNQTNYTLVNPTTNTNFKGGGSQKKSEDLVLTITARILKVLENGNYFVLGTKEILVDGEKQMIRVSGVVRPYDVARNNTVESKYLADAKIQYANIGDLSNTNKKKFAADAVESEFPY
ncbi:MAG: flagellar basal body L-ring protein FlgH [Helicobacter sp.]|mgnify:CR=1 FL=1|nr:flagellar basal body L-ring protein FlgH [Helicobacter sp.]